MSGGILRIAAIGLAALTLSGCAGGYYGGDGFGGYYPGDAYAAGDFGGWGGVYGVGPYRDHGFRGGRGFAGLPHGGFHGGGFHGGGFHGGGGSHGGGGGGHGR